MLAGPTSEAAGRTLDGELPQAERLTLEAKLRPRLRLSLAGADGDTSSKASVLIAKVID